MSTGMQLRQLGFRSLGLLLGIALVVGGPFAGVTGAASVSSGCGPFSDVPASHPACGAILKLVNSGVVHGYPDGTYRPEEPITRAEYAKMAVLVFEQAPIPGGALPFSDVSGHWAAQQGYLQAAVAMNAINGFEDGTFRPNEPVTRAQATKIPAAALGLYPFGTAPYNDVAWSDWFAGWVAVSYRSHVIGPTAEFPIWTGTVLNGNYAITRGEAAMVLANLPLIPSQAEQAISVRAAQAIAAVQNQNMATLAGLVHPNKGVRFTPYAYVHTGSNQTFPNGWLPGALTDSTVYVWGAYDGTGDPIELTFSQYYGQFVYDQDFANAPDISYNVVWHRGNSLNNVLEAYPGSIWVEYHFPGFDPQYGGMDWRSLRLVFEEWNGDWYLVGIIHDQWTI